MGGKEDRKSKERPAPAGVGVVPEPTVREIPSTHRHRIQHTGDIRNTAMQKLETQAKHHADELAEVHQVTPLIICRFLLPSYGMLRQLPKTKISQQSRAHPVHFGADLCGEHARLHLSPRFVWGWRGKGQELTFKSL